MLKVYKTTQVEKKIKKIKRIVTDSWIELTSPTNDEIDKVVEKTNVDKDLILKMLDDEERPRVEQSGNAILIVIDTPYLEHDESNNYKTYPLGIIITDNNYVITITSKRLNLLNYFKKNKVKNFRTAKKTRFLIQILLKTANYYLRDLKKIYANIDKTEQILKKSTENKELITLLEIEKTLVYFITSLKANDTVLEKLSKGTMLPLYEGDLDLLEDATIENKQAIEMSTIYRDILSSITDTYANIVSNNLNYIMKFLAGATIVLSIPTMISSFLGMNVPLGSISNYDNAFILILLVSVVISIVVAIILKKKNML